MEYLWAAEDHGSTRCPPPTCHIMHTAGRGTVSRGCHEEAGAKMAQDTTQYQKTLVYQKNARDIYIEEICSNPQFMYQTSLPTQISVSNEAAGTYQILYTIYSMLHIVVIGTNRCRCRTLAGAGFCSWRTYSCAGPEDRTDPSKLGALRTTI